MVPFVYLASVCQSLQCLISALTQAGGGGLLFRLLVSSHCGEGRRCFPVYAAQACGCSIWSVPCAMAQFQPSGVPQKRGVGCACVCAFPVRAAQAVGSFIGALSPGAAHLLPSAVPASVSARASWVCAPSLLRVPSPSPRQIGRAHV